MCNLHIVDLGLGSSTAIVSSLAISMTTVAAAAVRCRAARHALSELV